MSPYHLEEAIAQLLARPARTLLIIAATDVALLQDQTEALQERYGWPQLRVGVDLSAALLKVPPSRRPRQVRRQLADRIEPHRPNPVLCTHIDLLFDPELRLEPPQLFKHLAKMTPLIVFWPGAYRDDVLSYAVPEHAHYHTWRKPEALIVSLPIGN